MATTAVQAWVMDIKAMVITTVAMSAMAMSAMAITAVAITVVATLVTAPLLEAVIASVNSLRTATQAQIPGTAAAIVKQLVSLLLVDILRQLKAVVLGALMTTMFKPWRRL